MSNHIVVRIGRPVSTASDPRIVEAMGFVSTAIKMLRGIPVHNEVEVKARRKYVAEAIRLAVSVLLDAVEILEEE